MSNLEGLKARMMAHIANNDWHQNAISPETVVSLIDRVQDLEERASKSAALVAQAVELMQAKADMIDPRQTIHLASGYRLDAIGAMKGIDLPREGVEPDYDYRNRLLARLHEWRGPTHDGQTGPAE